MGKRLCLLLEVTAGWELWTYALDGTKPPQPAPL